MYRNNSLLIPLLPTFWYIINTRYIRKRCGNTHLWKNMWYITPLSSSLQIERKKNTLKSYIFATTFRKFGRERMWKMCHKHELYKHEILMLSEVLFFIFHSVINVKKFSIIIEWLATLIRWWVFGGLKAKTSNVVAPICNQDRCGPVSHTHIHTHDP